MNTSLLVKSRDHRYNQQFIQLRFSDTYYVSIPKPKCSLGLAEIITAFVTSNKKWVITRHLCDSNTRAQRATADIAGDPVNHSGKVTCMPLIR